MTVVCVLITDDQLMMREELRMMLGEYGDVQVVSETEETYPNGILVEPRMPELDAIAEINAQWPVAILATYHMSDLMLRGLQALLVNDTDGDTLLQTRPSAVPLPRRLPKRRLQSCFHPALSQRQLEILKLVAMGARNKEVAVQLGISQSTVKAHLDNIFNKLGVDSRTAAVSVASQSGLLVE